MTKDGIGLTGFCRCLSRSPVHSKWKITRPWDIKFSPFPKEGLPVPTIFPADTCQPLLKVYCWWKSNFFMGSFTVLTKRRISPIISQPIIKGIYLLPLSSYLKIAWTLFLPLTISLLYSKKTEFLPSFFHRSFQDTVSIRMKSPLKGLQTKILDLFQRSNKSTVSKWWVLSVWQLQKLCESLFLLLVTVFFSF